MSLATTPYRNVAPGDSVVFVAHDARFGDVLGPFPQLATVIDTDAHEGPVYVSDEDALYFTSVPRPGTEPASRFPAVSIKRLALDGYRFPLEADRVSVVVKSTRAANGMALDLAGRLVVCEQGTPSEHARISRLEWLTGTLDTVVDIWRGLRLNSPNDVVVRTDGTIWFTDPGYGHLQGFRPTPQIGDYVYRYDPRARQLTVVSDSFDKPNGLAFAPDETVLYVTDTGANQEAGSYYVDRPHNIKAFDVADGHRLVNERLFAVTAPGFPDGIKVDTAGRVYCSASSGVLVHSPEGELIGEIRVPGTVNFAFGGPDHNVLYITTDSAVWAAVLNATGPQRPATNLTNGA